MTCDPHHCCQHGSNCNHEESAPEASLNRMAMQQRLLSLEEQVREKYMSSFVPASSLPLHVSSYPFLATHYYHHHK